MARRSSAASAGSAARGRKKASQRRFSDKLVLNQWLLALFRVEHFERLAEPLRAPELEGLDENNVHHFHHALAARLFDLPELPAELLLEYDQNIVRISQRLNEKRITRGEAPIVWKYFQYLALLFVEIYLDRYFRDPEGLRAALNAQIARYNQDVPETDTVAPLDLGRPAWTQLNKIALWMATGSGKTLLMHANILQYRHYLERHRRTRELNRVLLLTPNEGLSAQHLREFVNAGLEAELFTNDARGLFSSEAIEVLDVHKLKDEAKAKTFAIDAFEGNNLVLVDEGHRGASGGEDGAWMRARNALCERGFSFEYSATFGQAVKGDAGLVDLYAKNVLFDYSYRWFYGDGFGKDYQILNLDDETQANHLELYLVACLLSFFQQQRLYREQQSVFHAFQLERPLWVFVGSSVTASLGKKEASDIVHILQFLARYVSDRQGSVARIERVLNQGLVTSRGKNLFAGRFGYLNTCKLSAAQVFDETLATLFNAPAGGQLSVENLKGATGEVALRLGAENDPFGVINVGEDTKLVKLCEEHGLATGEREFSSSLFHRINRPDSTVHVLIGSKKFTEGWSSWRVSTMGLMNVGKSEGAQIIQLFGRGVRLKGYGTSLKRSLRTELPENVKRPRDINVLETLGIFGIQANYMAQFRDFLEEEGLPTNEDRVELWLPVIRNLGSRKLKIIRLEKVINGVPTDFGDAFRKLGPIPTLAPPDPERDPATVQLQKNQVVVNWYPKIQAMRSEGVMGGNSDSRTNVAHLTARHVAFLDLDRLRFDLERYKAERGWYNLNITHAGIAALLADQSWYRLLIPAEDLAFDSYAKVHLWGEIALALLKKYTERYYTFRKSQWELPHLRYQDLAEDDPNLTVREPDGEGYYQISVEASQTEIVAKLEELRGLIERQELRPWEFRGIKAVWFGQHLYQPLLHADQKLVEIKPAALNRGETRFVEDLKAFHDNNSAFFAGKELYLLRNLSRGRGVGFFEAGNFYPDFILWLLAAGRQHVVFVDPKGIRNLPATDPKIRFHEAIKAIERRLGDESVRLSSFIVSNTPAATMAMMWGISKDEMKAMNILFQEEDRDSYVRRLLETALATA